MSLEEIFNGKIKPRNTEIMIRLQIHLMTYEKFAKKAFISEVICSKGSSKTR